MKTGMNTVCYTPTAYGGPDLASRWGWTGIRGGAITGPCAAWPCPGSGPRTGGEGGGAPHPAIHINTCFEF
jgi:hypothetical protein